MKTALLCNISLFLLSCAGPQTNDKNVDKQHNVLSSQFRDEKPKSTTGCLAVQFSSIGAGIPENEHAQFRDELKKIVAVGPLATYFGCSWGLEGERTYYLRSNDIEQQRRIEEVAMRLANGPKPENKGYVSVAPSSCEKPTHCHRVTEQDELLDPTK